MLVLAGDEVRREVVRVDRGALLHEARQDVVAEVVAALLEVLVLLELAQEHVGLEDVVAHRGEAHVSGCPASSAGSSTFSWKRDDAPVGADLEDAEVARLAPRHRDGGDRRVGARLLVEGDHLPDVHLVDVVAAEDADELRLLVVDDVLALPDGVGRAAVPGLARALLRGDGLDELIEDGREAPVSRDVLLERRALVLREHLDARRAPS